MTKIDKKKAKNIKLKENLKEYDVFIKSLRDQLNKSRSMRKELIDKLKSNGSTTIEVDKYLLEKLEKVMKE